MKYSIKKIKLDSGEPALVAADAMTRQRIQKLKGDKELVGDFSVPRNYQFHKKYFSLVKAAYDMWDAPLFVDVPVKDAGGNEQVQQTEVEKDFDKFRGWITIKAGYYKLVAIPNGAIEIVPQSISFSNMKDDEFESLFNNTLNVILKEVLPEGSGYEDALTQSILEYT